MSGARAVNAGARDVMDVERTHPIVVLGAGFAGLRAVRRLGRARVPTLWVDARNYHCFLPLLYQVAIAGLEPQEIAYPAEDAARRIRDLLRLEACDRDLVEERKEAVIVAGVDPEGRDARAAEAPDGTQPGEARAEHDDRVGPLHIHHVAGAGVDGARAAHLASRAVRTHTGGCHCGRIRF